MAYSIYNGVLAPSLPDFDREKYPHIYVSNSTGVLDGVYMSLYSFYATQSPLVQTILAEPGKIGEATCPEEWHMYGAIISPEADVDITDWETVERDLDGGTVMYTTAIWCNTDLKDADGNTLLKASELVPFTGEVLLFRGVSVQYNSMFQAYTSTVLPELNKLSVGDKITVVFDGVTYEETISTIPSFGNIPGFGSVDTSFTDRPYVFGKMDVTGDGVGDWLMVTTSSNTRFVQVLVGDLNPPVEPEEPEEPEQPKFDLKSWLMGYALGLTGKPLPFEQKEPVAYLYNGVQLPDINEVWADKKAYPYAYIVYASKKYQLYLAPTECTGTSGTLKYPANTRYHYFSDVTGTWSAGSVKKGGATYYGAPKWVSSDLYSAAGDLVLSASDPVPVYE